MNMELIRVFPSIYFEVKFYRVFVSKAICDVLYAGWLLQCTKNIKFMILRTCSFFFQTQGLRFNSSLRRVPFYGESFTSQSAFCATIHDKASRLFTFHGVDIGLEVLSNPSYRRSEASESVAYG